MSTTNEYYIEPGQSWEVDSFRPEDAEGVTRLFLSVYGEGYPIETYIRPELLTEANGSGRIVSSVARTPKGDIVGHGSIFKSAPYHGIRESGAGLVHASYRGGQGIFTGLVAHSIQNARRLGIEAVHGEPVCNHLFSQRMTLSLSYGSMALELDLLPSQAYEKEKSAKGRVAALFDLVVLQERSQTVFIPTFYEDFFRYLYSALADKREILRGSGKAPSSSSTRMDVGYFEFAQVGRMAVWEPGADFESFLEREEKRLLQKGAVVIQASVSLGYPWVEEGVGILRERGYFLGGLLPRWFDQDAILMQKILKRPDWEGIQLLADRAKKIREIVEEDWRRTEESKQ